MKVYNHLTTGLGMLSAFPRYSIGATLYPKKLEAVPAVPHVDAPQANRTKAPLRDQGTHLTKRLYQYYCSDHGGFFDLTPANWFASNAGQKYMEFTRSIDKTSVEWTSRVTEPAFFAKRTLRLDVFDCGITHRGCKGLPTCDEVLTRILGRGGDTAEARWIYFILLSMDTLTTVTAAVNDQTIPAQVDLASMSNSMAHTFFWKHDDKIDQKCQMLAGIVKAAIVAAFIVLGTIVAPAAAPATAGVGAALGETGAVAAIFGNTAARSSPWTMAALSNGARAWVKSTRQNSVLEKGVGIASNFPPNVGGDALERAICKNFPNAPKGNEEEAQRQIDKLIATNAENYREFIQSTNAEIMEGAGFGINGGILPLDTTVLAEVLQFGEYLKLTPEQHHRIVGEPHELEGEIKSYFQNAVVSVILESQMCYILCSGTKSKKPDRTSFEPEPGRFCEAKCWRNWKGAKTLELFGLDKLVQEHNDWDITVQDFLRASYDHYKNHGLGRGPMLPSVGTLLDGKVKSTSGSFLPVCNSQLPHIANGIPCMCGDKYGSETAAFWDVANFASWSAARSDSAQVTTHDSPEYLCGRRMAHEKILPVPYFFNLCRMGVHWPNKYERPRWRNGDNAHLIRGQDVSCEAFEGTVDVWHKGQSIGMMQGPEDPLDENCYMCYYSPIGQSIRKEQEKDGFGWKPYYPDLIDDESAFYNFDKACQKMRHDRKFPGGDIRRCRSPNYPDPEGDIGI